MPVAPIDDPVDKVAKMITDAADGAAAKDPVDKVAKEIAAAADGAAAKDPVDKVAKMIDAAADGAAAKEAADEVEANEADAEDPMNANEYLCSTGESFATYNADTLSPPQRAVADKLWPGKAPTHYACLQGCVNLGGTCTSKGRWPQMPVAAESAPPIDEEVLSGTGGKDYRGK